MKRYKISLVICVCDDLRIKKMLDSINDYCEVVIVLNGSPKKMVKLINKYKKRKPFKLKVLKIKEKNLSKARNVGILNATYDKVVFYDSDCIMLKNSLDYYDKMLDKYLIVDGKVIYKSDYFQSKIISVQRSMGLEGCALCPSMGINKKIIEYVNYYFDEDIKWIEDSELNIRVKKNNIDVGIINDNTCIHDNLTFIQDLKSAYRYGTGVKIAAKKGLHKKRPTANWNLIIPCFKKKFLSGIYCIVWNIVYCLGYYTK